MDIQISRQYLADKKEYDKAIADYTEATRLAPNEAHTYYGRGFARLNKKEYDKAIADFNEAIRLDPKNAGTITTAPVHGTARRNMTRRSPTTAQPSASTRRTPSRT